MKNHLVLVVLVIVMEQSRKKTGHPSKCGHIGILTPLRRLSTFKIIRILTLSSISFVWAPDMQKRALAVSKDVAGNPTPTVAILCFSNCSTNSLEKEKKESTK